MLYKLLGMILLPAASGVGAYFYTEQVFREKLVPYPFQKFGLAAGAGLYFFVLGIYFLIEAAVLKWREKR